MNPDIVGVFGGINDQGRQSRAVFEAETDLFFSALRSGAPGALVIAAGPWVTGTATVTSQNYIDIRDAHLASLGRIAGDWIFVDPLTGGWRRSDGATGAATGPWFFGTGSQAAPTGSGNADIYFVNGGDPHPQEAGALYAGHRLTSAIAEAMTY